MRTLILVAGAALTLAACRNNDQVDNTSNVGENLSAENMVSNDVTAIDAVTGDDANMAADVNYTDTTLDNNASTDLNTPESNLAVPPTPRKARKAPPPAPANSAAEANTINAE